MTQALYSVALYPTLGPDTTEYIINHADLSCVVCSLPFVPILLKLAPRLPKLKLIVCMDPLETGELKDFSKASLLCFTTEQACVKHFRILTHLTQCHLKVLVDFFLGWEGCDVRTSATRGRINPSQYEMPSSSNSRCIQPP